MKILKILKKKKKANLYDEESFSGWAETDRSRYHRLAKQAKFAGRRTPEFWVKDGDSRLLRFLDDDAVVSFQCYRMKLNGNWTRFTKPSDGKPDFFASKLGLRPGRVFVFRVIDIEGYTNKRGKKVTNQGKFLVASNKMYEQLRMLAKESEVDLNDQNVKMSRSGTSTDTTYMFVLKPASKMTSEMRRAAANFPKWKDYFRPPTTSEQKTIVGSVAPADEDEEEDNPY